MTKIIPIPYSCLPYTHPADPERPDLAESIMNELKSRIVKDGKRLKVKITFINNVTGALDICFNTNEDLNLYLLAGYLKQGKHVIFRDLGMQLEMIFQFHVLSEIYG